MSNKEEVQYTAEDFAKEYNELCKKAGFQITVTPTFVATNHGTFELSLSYAVSPLRVPG